MMLEFPLSHLDNALRGCSLPGRWPGPPGSYTWWLPVTISRCRFLVTLRLRRFLRSCRGFLRLADWGASFKKILLPDSDRLNHRGRSMDGRDRWWLQRQRGRAERRKNQVIQKFKKGLTHSTPRTLWLAYPSGRRVGACPPMLEGGERGCDSPTLEEWGKWHISPWRRVGMWPTYPGMRVEMRPAHPGR